MHRRQKWEHSPHLRPPSCRNHAKDATTHAWSSVTQHFVQGTLVIETGDEIYYTENVLLVVLRPWDESNFAKKK